jgi:hypothetical protein
MSVGVSGVLLLTALLAGCGPGTNPYTRIRDDVKSDLPGFRPGVTGDSLGGPYVAGAVVHFTAQHALPFKNHSGWTAEAVDPTVANVDLVAASKDMLQVDVHMLREGETLLRFFGDDKSSSLRSISLQVRTATVMRIYPGTRMKTAGAETDVVELGDTVRVATGGETSFAVRLFNGTGELFGAKALQVLDHGTDAGPVSSSVTGTAFHLWRDWLSLSSPTVPGVWQRTLAVNGVSMRSLAVHVVDDSEVVGANLFTTAEGKDGEKADCIAEGKSAAGEAIYGGRYSWKLGDSGVDGTGDVFHYLVKKKSAKTVTATLAGGTASTEVHAEKGSVGSSAEQSCAQAGGGLWALLVMALWMARRASAG